MPLILASGSATRAALLTQAGLIFERDPATVDERAAEEALGENVGPDDVAMVLAELKARDVSARRPGAHVIGADQTLALGDRRFHKPSSPVAGRAQLRSLSGETHHLHSAVVVIRDGEVLFRHQSSAAMTMRPLSDGFLDHYVAVVGDRVMGSVGAYQVEGFGIQLFEAIEGDHFTILGLPLLPLLAFLRHEGLILS